MTWQSQILALLAASLVRPLALAAAAWLILRVLKVRHPASLHAMWTAVLVGMIVLPLVTLVAPQWKLPLLPKQSEPVAQTQVQQPDVFTNPEPSGAQLNATATAQSQAPRPAWPAPQTLIVWCYLAGVLAMTIFCLTGWALLWRVMSKSRRLRARLLESNDVITPVTVGVLRPSVILPAGWRDWSTNTKRAVLAHEFAHIRRRDTLTSSLTRLAKCIYWFHPLAWFISRQISELAELSCDAAVLEKNRDPGGYSRILLGFAETVHAAGYRTMLPGLAIASDSGMSHRIDQVFELATGNLRKLSRPGAVLVLAGLPVMCLAAVVGLTAPPSRALHPVTTSVPSPVGSRAARSNRAISDCATNNSKPAVTQPTPRPKFDVASVRRCLPGDEMNGPPGGRGGGGGRGPRESPGRLRMQCLALDDIISFAYLDYQQGRLLNNTSGPGNYAWLRNGPAWIHTDWYTIDAETEDPVANGPTGPGTVEAIGVMKQMLQVVLEDRFQLKMHRETEDVPMFNLTVAKGGLKMKPMEEGGCVPHDPTKGVNTGEMFPPGKTPMCTSWGHTNGPDWVIDAAGQHLSNLANSLSGLLDRHVFDKTGVNDLFIYHLQFAHDETTPGRFGPEMVNRAFPPTDIPSGPSVFSVLDGLGLKLESTKGPSEYVVIDRLERPSEN